MKHPHLPSPILPVVDQIQSADAFGLRSISHEFLEFSNGTILNKTEFGEGKTSFDPFTAKIQATESVNRLFYLHPGEHLTLLDKERDLSLWERILPYPWGFLKGLHERNSTIEFAAPPHFQNDWNEFFGLLTKLENLLSSAEIAALHLSGTMGSSSLVMRFLRKKCVGIAADPIALSFSRRLVNGGLTAADLFDQWGTTSCFFTLKLKEVSTLADLNSYLNQALETPENLIRYRIPTLEDGVIEMGL